MIGTRRQRQVIGEVAPSHAPRCIAAGTVNTPERLADKAHAARRRIVPPFHHEAGQAQAVYGAACAAGAGCTAANSNDVNSAAHHPTVLPT